MKGKGVKLAPQITIKTRRIIAPITLVDVRDSITWAEKWFAKRFGEKVRKYVHVNRSVGVYDFIVYRNKAFFEKVEFFELISAEDVSEDVHGNPIKKV